MSLICATFEIKYRKNIFKVTYEPTGNLIEYFVTVSIGKDEIYSGTCKTHSISPTGARGEMKEAINNFLY